MKNDTVYQMVTDNIIAMLEKGDIPWQKGWTGITPTNLISKKPYRGINTLLLGCQGYGNPFWLTYRQATGKGGHVKKGKKGTLIVFWKTRQLKQHDDPDTDENKSTIPLLRYYKVFNVEQCEGVEYPSYNKHDNDPIKQCENVVAGYQDCPEIKPDLSRTYYSPTDDFIGIPLINQFSSSGEYYSTLFHELTHSTGHKNRLGRDTVTTNHTFGSEDYSKEELIAEMGASFLCAHAGIDHQKTVTENQAGYIQGWLKRLNNDRRLVIQAASKAQKAVDYILKKQNQKGNTNGKSDEEYQPPRHGRF